jgi:hypothetical protein
MKRLLFASLSFVTLMPVYAENPMQTQGCTNGRWWVALRDSSEGKDWKNVYLLALFDGLRAGSSAALSKHSLVADGTELATYDAGDHNMQEIARIIDSFYADPANIRVSICDALLWVHFKLAGWPPKQLDDFAAICRGFANAADPKK